MTDQLPLVSIGFPTYNRADGYLRTALSCILAQDYPRLEVLISDNCSSDNTTEVVREFVDERITYVRQENNIGAIANFNFCLDNANGEYFLLFHDDDLIDSDFVSTCMSFYDASRPASLFRTGTRIINGEGSLLREETNDSNATEFKQIWLDWCEGTSSFYLCSSLFNREHLQSVGGFLPAANYVCDIAAAVNVSAKAGGVNVRECKASFRVHSGELTHTPNMEGWCNSSIELLAQFEAHTDDVAFLYKVKKFILRMAFKRCMTIDSFVGRHRALKLAAKSFDSILSPSAYLIERTAGRVLNRLKIGF